MVNKNYIIQAHTDPKQLLRLVNKLNDGHSRFYVHIDKKSDIQRFTDIIQLPVVRFIDERVDCIWGDVSQVQAVLNLIQNVVRDASVGFTVLLSGQDYPIKNNDEIDAFLAESGKINFMAIRPVEEIWPAYKDRLEKYKFNRSSKRGDFLMLLPLSLSSPRTSVRALMELLEGNVSLSEFTLLFKKRRCVFDKQYGGSSWWALNYETLLKVNAFVEQHKEALYSYYKYTLSADEIFFQSIVRHLQENEPSIQVSVSITYANWTRKSGPLPVTFNEHDWEELVRQPKHKLFARKFDSAYSAQVLDMIDKNIAC